MHSGGETTQWNCCAQSFANQIEGKGNSRVGLHLSRRHGASKSCNGGASECDQFGILGSTFVAFGKCRNVLLQRWGSKRRDPLVAVVQLQGSTLSRLRLDEDLRHELPTCLKCMRLMGGHNRRLVIRPAAGGTLKAHIAALKRQGDLHCMMSMKTRWFTRAPNPQAPAPPQQNASYCAGLHFGKRAFGGV